MVGGGGCVWWVYGGWQGQLGRGREKRTERRGLGRRVDWEGRRGKVQPVSTPTTHTLSTRYARICSPQGETAGNGVHPADTPRADRDTDRQRDRDRDGVGGAGKAKAKARYSTCRAYAHWCVSNKSSVYRTVLEPKIGE